MEPRFRPSAHLDQREYLHWLTWTCVWHSPSPTRSLSFWHGGIGHLGCQVSCFIVYTVFASHAKSYSPSGLLHECVWVGVSDQGPISFYSYSIEDWVSPGIIDLSLPCWLVIDLCSLFDQDWCALIDVCMFWCLTTADWQSANKIYTHTFELIPNNYTVHLRSNDHLSSVKRLFTAG
jgi:hypothetical protein